MLTLRRSKLWLAAVPAALLLSVTAQAQSTITNGLVAYWSFDGNYLDSVKAFHGTPRGTAAIPFSNSVSTAFGQAISLNGEDQFVEITGGNEDELEFPGGSVSIAGWFKVAAFDTEWQALISKGEGTAYRVARRAATDNIAYAGGRGEGPQDSPAVNDGNWHHFVAVTDATGTNNPHSYSTALYVDGAIYEISVADPADTTTLAVLTANSLNLMIGENPGARNREWEGLIDDIAIWNRILTDDEVTNLYAGGVGKPLSTLLPPPAKLMFAGGVRPTSRSFEFTISDLETSILDPATAKLTIDGQPAPIVKTAYVNGVTTFLHTRTNTPWAAGSTHSYKIEANDTQARPLNVQASFTLPQPWFPRANLPGPNVTNQWAVRYIFNIGNLGTIPQVITAITNIGTAAFTGDYVDSTAPVINFGNSAFLFGNNIFPYPDDVINHPNWNLTEDGNHFIVFAVANIEVPEEGHYTFGVHSDDGFAYRIRGGDAISESGNGALDPVDPEAVVHPDNTGDSTTRAVYYLKKGVYRVEWFFWEAGGGQGGEFYSAKGQFQNDSDTTAWTLVGDTNATFLTFSKPGVAEPGWRAYGTAPSVDATINNLVDALNYIQTPSGPTNTYAALFMTDPQDSGGGAGAPAFPTDTSSADNYFVVRATGTLIIAEAGDYEIGFDSDDGGWMKMPGKTFTEIVKNGTGLAVLSDPPDEVQVDAGTGSSFTTVKVNLTAGNHPIEIGWYEMTGGGFLRGMGAKFGATGRLPTLELGPAGTYSLPPSLKLTTRPVGVDDPLRLTVSRSGNNITLQWTPTGGTLQKTTSLSGTPAWTDVGTGNPTTVPIGSGNAEFFRVKQ